MWASARLFSSDLSGVCGADRASLISSFPVLGVPVAPTVLCGFPADWLLLFREGLLSYFPPEAWVLSVESCAGGVFSGAALVGFMRWCRSPFCFPSLDFVCVCFLAVVGVDALVLPVLVVWGFLLLLPGLVSSLLPCKSLLIPGPLWPLLIFMSTR